MAVLALLLKFFSGRRNTDLFNPNDIDGLLNEDLQQAIEAVTGNDTPASRQKLYQVLLETTFCLPSSGAGEGTSQITATQNEAGEMVLAAFSDPVALRRWEPDTNSMLVMPSQKLFELAVENGFDEILINPAGPAGGKLTKPEFARLAQGVIPE